MAPTTVSKKLPIAVKIAVCALMALARLGASAQDYDPPPQAGRLSAVKGEVSFQQAGGDQWIKARRNMPLGPGDRIYTDEKGRAEVQIGETYLRVGPNTDVTLQSATPADLTFALAQGSAHVHAMGLWEGQAVYVNTPAGSVTLNTASQVRVDVYPEQQAAIFTDLVNNMQVTGAGDYSQWIEPGQALELSGSNPPAPQWLGPAEQDELDKWSHKRDRDLAQLPAYQYVSPQMAGAEDLDFYGTWVAGTPYGAMWYPNNVPAGWVPYRNGYWVNRAPWGWVWVEEEPWGYAPFHYGRWVNWDGRWAWVPGPRDVHPMWAPAQVAFVGGGNPGTSAWVPLGPGEAFWPWYHCSPGYVNQVNISNLQPAPRVVVQNVYVNRVNVTNVTYINQTHVTVVKQEDMASGRQVSQTAIPVTPVQVRQLRPVTAVAPPPARPILLGGPQTQPVPVSVNRPTVINASGNAVVAQPGARPVSVPVKSPPAAVPVAGRAVVAPPPGAKIPPVPPGVGNPVSAPGTNAGGPARPAYAAGPGSGPGMNQPPAKVQAGPGAAPASGPGTPAPKPPMPPVKVQSRPDTVPGPVPPGPKPQTPPPLQMQNRPAVTPAPQTAPPAARTPLPAPQAKPAPPPQPKPQDKDKKSPSSK
jgi:hypothetical protein